MSTNNEQGPQNPISPGGNAMASSVLSSEHHIENEDVTMGESTVCQYVPQATATAPVRTWLDSTTTEARPQVHQETRPALVKRAMIKDLPKFKILNDDMKDSDDAFVSVNQYFKAFERTFRMQNVDLEHNRWRDNLANVIVIDHADWYADTIEQNTSISYAQAKAMIMDHIE